MILFFQYLKPNILALALILPATVSFLLALEAWRPRYAPRGRVFTLLMLAVGIWSAAYGLELASITKQAMLFWLKVEYIAIPFISVLMLLVVMQFAGLNSSLRSKQISFLLIIPVITMFLSITHEYHGLYYKGVELNTSGKIPLLELSIGPWYYVHVIYSYLIIFYSVVLLSQKLYYQRSLFRNQLLFMLLAVLIPLITFTIYFAGLMPVKNIDPTPFAFAVSGLFMSVSILKFRMFDLMPIAREHIFRSMGDGLVVIDNKHRLVESNPIALKMFGWIKIPYGANVDILWHDIPELINICTEVDQTGIEFNIQIQNSERFFIASSSNILNHKKSIVGKLLIIHDVTHRHLLQETIRQSEEKLRLLNAEKDKLFSIIAHDLRGPIGAFSKLTEMFVTEADMTPEEMKEIAKDMNNSAQSLQGLLDNLLNWSRMQRDDVVIQKQNVEIKQLVDRVFELLKEPINKKSLFVKNLISETLIVVADENMIHTVMRNLVSNALKFTPKGGNIVIQSKLSENGTATISVRDTGIGMPTELVENLYRFDKKTGRPGTDGESSSGLGLVLCKDFIEKNDGRLFVESEEGKGSIFSFNLPVAG